MDNTLQQALLLGGSASFLMKNPHDATLFMAIRKFVCTSYRIYAGLERKVGEMTRGVHAEQFLQLLQQSSRNFREQLGNLLLDIELIASTIEDNPISFQHEYDLTAYIVAIWHLCEIFYLEVDENISVQRNTGVSNSTSMNMITWLKMNGTSPPLEFEFLLEKFRNTPHPQLHTTSTDDNNHRMEGDAMIGDDNGFVIGYWDSIFTLVMEGRLHESWELLALHDEIAAFIAMGDGASSSGSGSSSSASRRDDADRHALRAIYDILSNHPFTVLVNGNIDAPAMHAQYVSPNLSLELKDWQNNISRVLESNSDIIARIPELSTMLLMLMADSETLVEWSHGDWTAMATALFLYKYPPPCSRHVIDRVVNEAMDMIPLKDIQVQHPDELVREQRLRRATCDIIHGDAALFSVIRSLVDLCGWGRPTWDRCSLFGLLSAGHLTYLLTQAGSGLMGASGYVNVTVETIAQLLGEQSTSLVVYNDSSNSSQSSTADLSTRIREHMPNETSFMEEMFLESAQRLNALEFPLDVVVGYLRACPRAGVEYARVLLPRRPMLDDTTVCTISSALRTMGLNLEASAVEIARGSWWLQNNRGQDNDPSVPTGRAVVKALRFFQLGGDLQRSNALMDRALWRLCTSVIQASQSLEREAQTSPMVAESATVWKNIFPSLPRGLRLLPMKPRGPSRRGDNTVADYWDLRHYVESVSAETNSPNASTATSRLFHAINHAEQLLGAVFRPDTLISVELICLKSYMTMIRALITSRIPTDSTLSGANIYGDINALLVELPTEIWPMLGAAATTGTSRIQGDNDTVVMDMENVLPRVTNTLCALINDDVASMRFWMHFLDMAVGINNIEQSHQRCLFEKDQVYRLLANAERVITWHSHYSGSLNVPNEIAVEPIHDEDVRNLRLGLLGMFTASVIQANADAGATHILNSEYHRNSRKTAIPTAKPNSMHLLTASSFQY